MVTAANALNISSAGLVKFDGTATFSGVTTTQHDVLIGSASNGITNVAPSATSGVALISQGAAADPTFGTVVVAGGGTGAVTLTGVLTGNGTSAITASTVTQHGVLVGGASNAVSSTAVGSTGQVLQANSAADPTYSTATFPSTATSTGTILRADGTNWSATTATYPNTTTSQQILYSSAANTVGGLATGNSLLAATNSSGTLAMRAFSVNTQVFTATGTYTPTTGMLYCIIEVIGSGGGSGGCATTGATTIATAGGGGGGGYARGTFSSATIGASQAVTVGAAGTAGTAGANNGGTGGTVSVGALISATGGAGGAGSTASGNPVFGGGGGGTGTGGDFQSSGQPGGFGFGSVQATNSFLIGGYGGASVLSGGGTSSSNGAANAASSYGSGGGGGSIFTNAGQIAGVAGAKGIVIIREYIIN